MAFGKSIGALVAISALSNGPAQAQSFTQLIAQGDPVPGGSLGELVTHIDEVDINNAGDWAVLVDSDGPTDGDAFALVNGTIEFQEGTATGIPIAGTRFTNAIDLVDLNDNGDRLFLVRTTAPSLSLPNQAGASIIRNGIELYRQDFTVCAAPGAAQGLLYTDLHRVWQNNSDQLLLGARVGLPGNQILVKVDLDPMTGLILSESLIAMETETLAGHATPIEVFSFAKGRNAINDSGDVLWFEADERGAPNGVRSDSNFYLNSTPLYNEADTFPPAPLEAFDSLDLAVVSLNNAGAFVFSGFDRRPETEDAWIFKSSGGTISVLAHEGDPVPASVPGAWLVKGFGFGELVPISDDGDVLWFLDWNDPDTSKDTGLLFNDDLLLQEGVTLLDGLIVTEVPSADSALGMSNDGRKAIIKVELTGGIEAAYLVDHLKPDPFLTFCDPATPNSTMLSTKLAGYFLTGMGLGGGQSDLHLECFDGVPGGLAYYLTGEIVTEPGTAISDGRLCLIGGAAPFFRYTVTGSTASSVGFFNAAGVLENLAGTSSVGSPGNETGFDVPTSIPGTSQLITAGSTWHFQVWHRDTAHGSSHSNFSNGLSVTFQ